ncbi:hypothetical protein ACG9X6_18500 [Acinetobacter guillouiae]|uniref:hypothetical protein n=1 Tax=Acinetobacter TaxID=469 RepID=UPI0002CFBD09|nr:hypothetical protein [Acinetobacter junii]ENV52102.1 hypothetical protein F953_00467 [Acinetobacter junii CIP 107470 = MTCC 11364]MDH1916082.1 hypothetical protein [Acinetobacter junii]
MNNYERLITALYYSIGGIILGLGLAIFTSFYLSTSFSSVKIVIITVISCFIIGYLFPNIVGNIFRWIWKIFID